MSLSPVGPGASLMKPNPRSARIDVIRPTGIVALPFASRRRASGVPEQSEYMPDRTVRNALEPAQLGRLKMPRIVRLSESNMVSGPATGCCPPEAAFTESAAFSAAAWVILSFVVFVNQCSFRVVRNLERPAVGRARLVVGANVGGPVALTSFGATGGNDAAPWSAHRRSYDRRPSGPRSQQRAPRQGPARRKRPVARMRTRQEYNRDYSCSAMVALL